MMLVRKYFLRACIGVAALFTASSALSVDECLEELMISYYPEHFVAETLEKFQIPQAQRSAIIRELAEKDQEVVATVEERAAKMTPNPLRDPAHRQEAVKIFRDTLYGLFANVMENHGINDKEQIHAMLDDVQQQKAKEFAACMDVHRSKRGQEMGFSKREHFSRQQRGPNTDYNNYETPMSEHREEDH